MEKHSTAYTELLPQHKSVMSGGVAYLPGFVRVFHSGRLFYVDFCRIHTSRLFRKRGEKGKITSGSTQNQIINSFGCLRAANFTAVMSLG